MRPLRGLFLTGLMALLPLSALAEPVGFIAGFDRLYRVDLATGQTTSVGLIGFNDVEGLALDANGTLYGVADATFGEGSALTDFLVRINTSTGEGSLVGPLSGLGGIGPGGNLDYGLALTCDGRLWLSSDTTRQLWEVNPANATTRLVGNTGQTISGLAGLGNELYGVSVDTAPSLYSIDPATAQATLIGALNVGGDVADAGLDFDATGRLWAVLDPEPIDIGASRFARIDPISGAGTIVSSSNVAAVGMEGLAIAAPGACNVQPVPSEASSVPGPGMPLLVLLAAIAAALGLRRLRPA
jgi:hypothetical protein